MSANGQSPYANDGGIGAADRFGNSEKTPGGYDNPYYTGSRSSDSGIFAPPSSNPAVSSGGGRAPRARLSAGTSLAVAGIAASAALATIFWVALHKTSTSEHSVAAFRANTKTVTDYTARDGFNTCVIPAGTPIHDRGRFKDTNHLYEEPMDRASPPPGTCADLKIGSWVLPHRIMGAIRTTGTKISSTDPQT